MSLIDLIANELEGARARSLALLEPLSDEELRAQYSPLMSPLVWDLAHVGNYEEQWLLRNALGTDALVEPGFDDTYNPQIYPRVTRGRLKIAGPERARAYVGDVRSRVLESLGRADLDNGNELTRRGYVYGMVIQHEHMHDETMLATLQLKGDEHPLAMLPVLSAPPASYGEVLIDGGPFVMGTDDEPWAFDNERPAHVLDLPAFYIDVAPVTNAEYAEFIEAGGYDEPRWWAGKGWAWRVEADLRAPEFWSRDGDAWSVLRYGKRVPLPPDEPVQHVCWYEADAYARWAGKRLPTEAEWEKAASWDAAAQRKRRYPWGDEPPEQRRANLGQRWFGPLPATAFDGGESPYGCLQMLGDVWEWCASDFRAYPGFRTFPYAEYSEIFFGEEYKVLRGGSWATHPTAVRNTFRNWDYPIRRQIFCGFRCARDADVQVPGLSR